MSRCCREIYWACYQHRKSRSLGANGRCFAYCGIFSYCALSLPARTAQAGGMLSLLLACQQASLAPSPPALRSPRQGLLRAQSNHIR